MVLVAHARVPRAGGGGFGVHLFFVLSGFLITRLLLAEHDRCGSVSLVRFWGRRGLRLLPALAAAMAATVAYALATDRSATLDAVPSVLGYWSNLRVSVAEEPLGLFGAYWSLAVEEQFYVVWPVLLVAAAALGLGRRALLRLALLGCAVVLALRVAVYDVARHHVNERTDLVADLLLLGCALALAIDVHGVDRIRRATRVLAVPAAGAVAALVATGALEPSFAVLRFDFTVGLTVLGLAGAVLVGHLATDATSPLSRAAAHPAAVYLGRISYPVYLWHVLVFAVVDEQLALGRPASIVLGIAATGLAAAISYHMLERPLLRRFRPALVTVPRTDLLAPAGRAPSRCRRRRP